MSGQPSERDREEQPLERLDRNWSELLQETRVAQTGIQLLTGFLLILPFQQRFTRLDAPGRWLYLVTVLCSITAAVLLQAPVSMHRILFRRHRRAESVRLGHRFAVGGVAMLGLATIGVTMLVFLAVEGWAQAITVGVFVAGLLAVCWLAIPLRALLSPKTDDDAVQ